MPMELFLGQVRTLVDHNHELEHVSSFGSRPLDHSCQQERAAWQLCDQNVLVHRVRSLSDTTHAIECGNPDARSEISIRTSADSSLFKLPTDFFRNPLSLAVQP